MTAAEIAMWAAAALNTAAILMNLWERQLMGKRLELAAERERLEITADCVLQAHLLHDRFAELGKPPPYADINMLHILSRRWANHAHEGAMARLEAYRKDKP
jgi:hypothetical protein